MTSFASFEQAISAGNISNGVSRLGDCHSPMTPRINSPVPHIPGTVDNSSHKTRRSMAAS